MAKELPEETKQRLQKQKVTTMTMVLLQFGIKIENSPKSILAIYEALYNAGMADGAKEMMKVINEPVDPKDIPF